MKQIPIFLDKEPVFANLPPEQQYSTWLGEPVGTIHSEQEITIMPIGFPHNFLIHDGPKKGYVGLRFILESAANNRHGFRFEPLAAADDPSA